MKRTLIALALLLLVAALATAASYEMPRFLYRGTPMTAENQQALEHELAPVVASQSNVRVVVTISDRVVPSEQLSQNLTPRAARTR